MASPILQGLLGGSLILQGYGGLSASPSTPDDSHVVLQGFGGGSLILQGYGGPSGPPGLPVDLLAAIQQTILASAAADLFTGGVFSVKASDRSTMPYVVVRERSTMNELRTSSSIVASVCVETRVYAATTDQAGIIGDALRTALEETVNTFEGGAVTPLIVDGNPKHGREPGRGRDNVEIRFQEQIYTCRVKTPKKASP